jgi:hypothetical protein
MFGINYPGFTTHASSFVQRLCLTTEVPSAAVAENITGVAK